MCLIAFHWQPEAGSLQVWANRDEFHARPAQATAFWPEAPGVLAGKDLLRGGSWMGVTRNGRFAALTNYRDPRAVPGERSRGELISGFLTSSDSAACYAERVQSDLDGYGGFSLLVCDGHALWLAGTHEEAASAVPAGWHGLSNARLDTPWPKLTRLVALARQQADSDDSGRQLDILCDDEVPDEAMLPDTGVGQLWERLLAPICIRSPAYGTRNSTWLRITPDSVRWEERLHPGEERLSFSWSRQS